MIAVPIVVAPDNGPLQGSESTAAGDSALFKRIAALELRLLEKEAQVEDLQARVEEMRTAVVQTRAQVPGAYGRAEAASGMAEAELIVQSLKAIAPPQHPDVQQAARLLRQSAEAFDNENYGGALYLASQARTVASTARGRIAPNSRVRSVRAGETLFAVPVRLKVTRPGNVHDGPGTEFAVVYAVEGGAALTGLSYTDEWLRVSDDRRRIGWIGRSLVGRR